MMTLLANMMMVIPSYGDDDALNANDNNDEQEDEQYDNVHMNA